MAWLLPPKRKNDSEHFQEYLSEIWKSFVVARVNYVIYEDVTRVENTKDGVDVTFKDEDKQANEYIQWRNNENALRIECSGYRGSASMGKDKTVSFRSEYSRRLGESTF